MFTAKIDVTKVKKEYLYTAKSGAKYLDIVLFANKGGAGEYGDTHYIIQSVPKDVREAMKESGERMPIIGNAKDSEIGQGMPTPEKVKQAPVRVEVDEEVPF